MIQILQQAKSHLAKGNFDKTFQSLKELFQSDDKYNNLSTLLLQYQTQYAKIKEDEALGVISIENARIGYNRVTKGLVDLIKNAENNDLSGPQASRDSNAPTNRQFLPILAIILVGIIGFFVYYNVLKTKPNKPSVTTTEKKCPDFKPQSAFNILVLPFKNYAAGPKNNLHVAFRDRLNRYAEKNNLNTSAKVSKIDPDNANYPDGKDEARAIARNCNAKLIIWGSYEKETSADFTIVTTEFQFLDIEKHPNYALLDLDVDNQLDTISSISSIASEGVLSSEIEGDIEKLLLGLIARSQNKEDIAIKYFESVNPNDKKTSMLAEIALADTYISTNQPNKAIATYTKILDKRPKNTIALTNRAALNLQKGNYKDALKDTNKRIKINPKDKEARAARLHIQIKSGNVEAAKKEAKELEKENISNDKIKAIKNRFPMLQAGTGNNLIRPTNSIIRKKITN